MKKNKRNSDSPLLFRCNGGIPFRILLILFTLLLVGGSLFFMLENQKKKNKIEHRKALELSDYGFQELGKKAFNGETGIDPEKIEGIEKKEHEGGWYAVTVSTTRNDSILSVVIESEGGFGTQSAVQKKTIQFKREVLNTDDSIWVSLSK